MTEERQEESGEMGRAVKFQSASQLFVGSNFVPKKIITLKQQLLLGIKLLWSLNVYLIFHTLIHRYVDPNFYYKSKNRLLSPAAAASENPSISHSKDIRKNKQICVT